MGAGPVVYPRGTVAIANSNNPMMGRSNTGAAQFFIVWSDSQLSPTSRSSANSTRAG